jgi:hypothetical protein
MEMKKLTIILVVALGFFQLSAQEKTLIDFGIARHYRLFTDSSYDFGKSGASLRISTEFPLSAVNICPGIELGSSTISNYLAGTIGVYHQFPLTNSKFSIRTGINSLHGALLFQQSPLYLFGFSEETSLNISNERNNKLAIFLEARYLSSPGYKEYSTINRFLELHLGIRYSFLKSS